MMGAWFELALVCLVILFPFSAVDKILHWNDAMKQAETTPLPFMRTLMVVAIVVEFVTPVCIVAGWERQAAAFVLAGFCVMTAVLYHQFWRYPDFWAAGDSVARSHFWDFLKNFGLVGGLMFVMVS